MKVAINKCFGGFSLSKDIFDILGIKRNGYRSICNEDLNIKSENYYAHRADNRLISAIEKIGTEKAADERYSKIEIIDIPDGIDWEIYDYDGVESIHEKHRSW